MNILDSFLRPDRAYKKAEQPIKEAWEEAQRYAQPFYDAGTGQIGRLNEAENALLNPVDLQNKWASAYEMSPYAQQQLQRNRNQGLEAASSMGLMGSSAALNNIQSGAGEILNADRQQFLNDLMQKYLSGIGIGQNIYGIGATTGQNLGQQAMQKGENLSGLEYGRAAAPGDWLGKWLGMGVDVGANMASGGAYGLAKQGMKSGGGSVRNSYLS